MPLPLEILPQDVDRAIADAYNRTRLTPFIKGLFKKWLAWRR
ncbi:MAG: hypothetical protein QME90_03275 [Thermodesulfobacteriota bacterium]|nr:hypothetical protein [Thermodesulfobacteriota bacterium]